MHIKKLAVVHSRSLITQDYTREYIKKVSLNRFMKQAEILMTENLISCKQPCMFLVE